MNDPTTLLLPHDQDERTTIDRRFGAASAHTAFRGLLRGTFIERWRSVLSVCIVGVLIGALLAALRRERRTVERLRQSIALLESQQRISSLQPSIEALGSAVKGPGAGRNRGDRRLDHLDRAALEHRGAELLLGNDLRQALFVYRELSERQPNLQVFSDFVLVLEAKLRCRSSQPGRGRVCK